MIDTRQAGYGCNESLTIYSERNKESELPHTRSYMLLGRRITSCRPVWALQQDPVEGEGTTPSLFPSDSVSSTSVERTACYYILT